MRRVRAHVVKQVGNYNVGMARGWESKSVEAQMEAAAEQKPVRKSPLSAEQAAQLRRKQRLALARKHVIQQLEATQSARHREMLEQALIELDAQLAEAEQGSINSDI
jgi:hypothetical protein